MRHVLLVFQLVILAAADLQAPGGLQLLGEMTSHVLELRRLYAVVSAPKS